MQTAAPVRDLNEQDLPIHRISLTRPLRWLALGWRDTIAARPYSLVYGGAVALFGLLVTLTLTWEGYGFLVPFLVAGFYLVAPAIGLGLVQMSANLEKGNKLEFCQALEALRGNQGQLGMVIAGLSIIAQVWIAANFVLYALLYTGFDPTLERFFNTVFFSEEGRGFAIASLLVGFVLAWAAFAISAISIPMLVDRDVDGWTAIRTSVRAVARNWAAMTLWAGLIVAVIAIGFSPLYLGLVVALPVIGHATWYAYRDLVPGPA